MNNLEKKRYEFLIIGSGVGGATLAVELSRRGKEVLLVERGKYEAKIGTIGFTMRAFQHNRFVKLPLRSKEGIVIWRTIMAGGSAVASCGCAARCMEEELSHFGINLDFEFKNAEREMKIAPISEKLLSKGSRSILKASEDLGYKMERMSKFINPESCRKCGHCTLGCVNNAKWTPLDYLNEAINNGVKIIYNINVKKVMTENGKAIGVMGIGFGRKVEILGKTVILACGGVGTPIILQNSGIKEAGEGLFVDLVVNTYGVTKGIHQINEPPMALIDNEFKKSKGFFISSFINSSRPARFAEAGIKGFVLPSKRLIGIMTKIADEPSGRVYPNGSISKRVTEKDREKLNEGSKIAKEILIEAGADKKRILFSNVTGGHPGGTAAIGKIVNKDLQTKLDNLFVCDASIFPVVPGIERAPLVPILPIAAIAKRLGKFLLA